MDEWRDSIELPSKEFGSNFNTKEDPLLRREGRDLYDSLFPCEGTRPLFSSLIFIGGDTVTSLGLDEGDLCILVVFALEEHVLGFSIFFNRRAPPFEFLFTESMPFTGLKEDGLDLSIIPVLGLGQDFAVL
jgi:hypothetical protein